MKYNNGEIVKVGDVITDGSSGREEYRLKNKAKVSYIDKFNILVFALNEFTCHGRGFKSFNMGIITCEPLKIEIDNLTKEELEMYNNSDLYLKE